MARDDADDDKGRANDICKILLKDVRLSYPQLFRAKAFGDGSQGEPAFSAEFLIDKDTSLGKKQIDMVWDAIDFCKDKLRQKNGKDVKIAKDKPFFKDGDDPDYERPETIGHRIVSSRNPKKPRVLGIDKEDLHESDGVIYAGCRVDAIVRIWAQDNKFGKRVNCSLEAVRFRADGEAFGAAPINPDEFEDIESGGSERRRSSSRDDDDRGRGRDRDDDRSDSRRGRDDDRGDERGSRRGGRDEESDDDRSARRSRDAEGGRDDDDRNDRRSRDDDDRSSRRGGREDDREERGGRSSRDDDDRGGRGGRDERDGGRSSGRDRDDDRGRGRDDDRRSSRDDDDRGERRSTREAADDRDRPSERSRSRGRGDDRDIV